ncbi:type IVa secretion system component IcmB, partial [mine drainage metagenome]
EHDGFCDKVFDLFSKPGITLATKLTAHEIISAIRREIQPESTSANYRPCLPGDRPPASTSGFGERPWEDIYYPPVWSQVCNTMVEESLKNGFERVFVDGLWHGTVSVDLPPQRVEKFEAVMNGLRHIPFRISYRMTPGGLSKYKFNDTLVQFLAFNPKSN